MGGKNKKGDRTKDHARPSSSSHCAELLGSSVPVFFDFSVAKDSFFGLSDEWSCNIDTNFQIVLKKITKKDSVTKLKALQVLADLCKNSDADTVKTILPFWPRLYCSLAIDVEHRVREAVHIAHAAIVEKVRKSIAPYLKQLAGPWFTSQYDNYPPAASAAILAFEQAFPPEKQIKVLMFCQEEILNYIYESLIKHTPETLSNPKTTKKEEMDAKYQRVVIATLQGYNLYLQKLSSDQIKAAEESNKKIVSSPRFWEYSKNKISVIRNSFFNVIISLCQNAKFLLSNDMRRVTVAIFNDLDDSDPTVMTCVWDAALNALVFLEDAWAHVNFEKQVFPKLNAVIKKGGRNAITIFPCILPLLSKIPCHLLRNKTEFYGTLFQNIRLIMEGKSIINPSYSDGKTIAGTFAECFMFIIMQNISDQIFCTTLISDQLIPALEKVLSSTKSSNSLIKTLFFWETSKLLRGLQSKSLEEKEYYDNILNLIWESLLQICKKTLEVRCSKSDLSIVLSNHLEFLKTLQNPKTFMDKSKKKLRFMNDFCIDESNEDGASEIDGNVNEDEVEFKKKVLEFAKSISGIYFMNSVEMNDGVYIPNLSEIVKLFDPKIIIEEFLKVQNEISLYSLFCNVFWKWLENPDLRRGELVDLSFSLLQHLGKDEKELILQKFCQDWPKSDLQYDICRSLLHYSDDDCIRSWILSEEFSNHLLQLAENVVNAECDSDVSCEIITTFFKARDINGECMVGTDTASSVMKLISKSLRSSGGNVHVRELAYNLVANMDSQDCRYRNSFEELIIALLKLSCNNGDDENLIKSCGIGLRSILHNAKPDFAKKLADAIKEIILSDNGNFSITHVLSRISYFIELSVGSKLNESSSSNAHIQRAICVIKYFVEEPAIVTTWRKGIERFCSVGYQSVENFDMKFVDVKEKEDELGEIAATSRSYFNYILNKLKNDFDNGHFPVTDENLKDDFKIVLAYYNTCKRDKYSAKFRDLSSESEIDNTPEMLVKFARWNIYVGSVINLVLSAHPGSYKTSVLRGDWCPYFVDENQLATFKDRNPNSNILPIKVTSEEMDNLLMQLKNREESFDSSEYEERLNVLPICGEVFDFVFSVGLLLSFARYYAGTSYFPILKEFTHELKRIGSDLFMNANLMEYLFLYHSCNYFVLEVAKWRAVKPVLEELFHRKFLDEEFDLNREYLDDFINGEVAQTTVRDNTLLKLCCITESKIIFAIEETDWNRIFIYLHAFFENFTLQRNISECDLTTISLLARITLQLMKLFDSHPAKDSNGRLCPEACLAWNELVRGELRKQFFLVWQKLAEKWHDRLIVPEMLIAIQNISEVITLGGELDGCLGEDKIKQATEYIRYIKSPHMVFQLTSFRLLLRLVPELVKLDTETFCKNLSKITEDMKEGSFKASSRYDWTCKHLEKVVSSCQGIVETLLSDFVIGDCCSVEPFTDSFNYTYSYLLIWCFLLDMCREAHSSLKFHYGFWMREKSFTNSLLESVFKLMPQSVIHGSEAKENCHKYFEKYEYPNLKEPVTSERIEQVACFVYRMFLQQLPNVIREWWSQSENKTSALVDKVTSLYVSPILIANELKSLHQNKDESFDNMEIKTHPNAREVVATYTIDEVKMDLIMTLPQNYPLGTIKIESSNMVVSSSSRRNWMFHISKYLIHQNGSIWEALIMWKSNLDKKFEGVKECYICASILQGSTFDTPKACCKICKKKFHSHCLYKWFSTSNNSSCPICRNLF